MKAHPKTCTKGPMDSDHLYSETLLDLKLCHKAQTDMCTMETCIRVRSIWYELKNEEYVLRKNVAVAVTCEAACTVSDIKCCVHMWVGDWLVKGSGVSGFICLVELQIVHLERKRGNGYWILADMRYSYGRACTVASSGTPLTYLLHGAESFLRS